MSGAELKSFENQLSFLSYAEQLSVMEFLIKLMKKKSSGICYYKTSIWSR